MPIARFAKPVLIGSTIFAVGATAATLGAAAIGIAAGVTVLRRRHNRPGQTALITGGSRGLGLAIAERFARAGYRIALTARKLPELEEARRHLLAIGAASEVLLFPADLSDRAQAEATVQAAVAAFGHLDVLINNAGIIEVGPLENQPVEAFERAMQVNFFAALYTSLGVYPHMLARGGKRAGAIVNIASIGGKLAVPHMLPYTASKFALVGFSEGLHAELRHKGIRVTTVCPGLMRTGGEDHAQFVGNVVKEKQWFNLAAKTPGIAVSTKYAANKIYNAVVTGRAEVTISPQAWLAARFAGLAPEITQQINSLVNQYILPAPQRD